jgi:hypothetical protein
MTATRASDGSAVGDRVKSTAILASSGANHADGSNIIIETEAREHMSDYNRALVAYHIVVVLWGFTAILGKLISYGSVMLVWHRCVHDRYIVRFIKKK